MKPYLIILFLSCKFLTALSQSKDEGLIKEVIDKESRFYGEGNYEKWASFWVKGPETLFIVSDNEQFIKVKGWENISAAVKPNMDANSRKNNSDTMYLERDDFQFAIDRNLAFVSYRQRDNFLGRQEKIESRVMKKVNGEWKILCIQLIRTHTYEAK
jgi:hypothetical protein